MRQKKYRNVTFCADPEDWDRMRNLHPPQSLSPLLRALIRDYLRKKLAPPAETNKLTEGLVLDD